VVAAVCATTAIAAHVMFGDWGVLFMLLCWALVAVGLAAWVPEQRPLAEDDHPRPLVMWAALIMLVWVTLGPQHFRAILALGLVPCGLVALGVLVLVRGVSANADCGARRRDGTTCFGVGVGAIMAVLLAVLPGQQFVAVLLALPLFVASYWLKSSLPRLAANWKGTCKSHPSVP
jgi:hypothetical protein